MNSHRSKSARAKLGLRRRRKEQVSVRMKNGVRKGSCQNPKGMRGNIKAYSKMNSVIVFRKRF
jgi:hypothetical protein